MHKIRANSLFIGKKLEILPHCHSTNRVASEMLMAGIAPEGTLILTHDQTDGKGQRGNNWESEPGKNLTLSVVLTPRFLAIKDQFYLNMITSLAVANTVYELTANHQVKVKWPNDVYVNDQKICGILIENSLVRTTIDSTVIGIGLNVNQESFTYKKATSFRQLTLKEHDLYAVLDRLIEHLEHWYIKLRSGDLSGIKKKYINNLYWMYEERLFQAEKAFIGKIIDVDGQGRLVVESQEHTKAYDIKEISFIQ